MVQSSPAPKIIWEQNHVHAKTEESKQPLDAVRRPHLRQFSPEKMDSNPRDGKGNLQEVIMR